MTKDNPIEWSETPADNATIASIGIDGTSAVSNFDNAFRALMAQTRTAMNNGNLMGSEYLSKSAGYTPLAVDRGKTINCTAALTLSLTAAATLGTGWICTVKANGGNVTIDPNASETINGAATYVVYDGNSADIICDGTNFQVVHLGPIATKWVEYTPTFVGFGTPTNVRVRSRRVGASLETQFHFTTGTATAVTASMTLGFNGTNSNVTIDSGATNGIRLVCGVLSVNSAFVASHYVLASGTAGLVEFGVQSSTSNGLAPVTGSGGFGSSVAVSGSFSVPITGW